MWSSQAEGLSLLGKWLSDSETVLVIVQSPLLSLHMKGKVTHADGSLVMIQDTDRSFSFVPFGATWMYSDPREAEASIRDNVAQFVAQTLHLAFEDKTEITIAECHP